MEVLIFFLVATTQNTANIRCGIIIEENEHRDVEEIVEDDVAENLVNSVSEVMEDAIVIEEEPKFVDKADPDDIEHDNDFSKATHFNPITFGGSDQ